MAEIREEQEEHERRTADPDTVPALQVNHIDFSYGQVQILFDVSFEVRKGEVLALLGTNGAGKSTILRVIAGLGTPARGVVRHNGRTITYVAPETRTKLGIHMLPGGKGVFGDMTDGRELGDGDVRPPRRPRRHGPAHRSGVGDVPGAGPAARRAGGVAVGRPAAAARPRRGAGLRPEILIIDELSLGLAPIMVERLVGIIDRLKGTGMTIIVVEQSLNVAAAIAERAVFLEKGHVRFEGAMAELVERDDLARAVFLGTEGG